MKPEQIYETELVNRRDEETAVLEYGRVLLRLPPGQSVAVYSRDPSTTYARFRRVVYEKDGTVTVKANDAWNPPELAEGVWPTEVLNLDGAPTEAIRVNDSSFEAYKGVPMLAYPGIHDPLAWYKRVTMKNVTTRTRYPGMPEYLIAKTALAVVKEPRSKSDCRRIKAQIEARFPKDSKRTVRVPADVEL